MKKRVLKGLFFAGWVVLAAGFSGVAFCETAVVDVARAEFQGVWKMHGSEGEEFHATLNSDWTASST